jgi:hypothetical protein
MPLAVMAALIAYAFFVIATIMPPRSIAIVVIIVAVVGPVVAVFVTKFVVGHEDRRIHDHADFPGSGRTHVSSG